MRESDGYQGEPEPFPGGGFPDLDLTSTVGLRRLALKDELTDLHNRRYLTRVLREERRRVDRTNGIFSLMFIDVDNFKDVNDSYGHLCGDKVLVEVGKVLKQSVRDVDHVCRYAGDEFVVVLPNAGDDEATSIADRISTNLASCAWAEKGLPVRQLTLSIGLALYPKDGADATALVESADRALYVAKRRGRNLCCSTKDLTVEERTLRTPRPSPPPQFVGRKNEWRTMGEILERSSKGLGGVLFISGETGVGKTRLVKELEAKGLLSNFLFLRASCHEETMSIPYFPFREAFARFFQTKEEHLKYYRHLKDAYRSELVKLIPQIDESPPMEITLDKYRLFEAVRSLLFQVSHELPLFFFIDDLHWADEASLELLHYLARLVRTQRVLICGTLREEELADSKGGSLHLANTVELMSRERLFEFIHLDRLSPADTSTLIDSIFPDSSIPQAFKAMVYSRTEGNPFFVEEILRSLEDELSQKGFDAKRAEEVLQKTDVPWSVRGIIEGRLKRLDEREREILSRAAVLGKEVSFDILLGLSGVNEGHLLDVIDRAKGIQLLKEDQGPEGTRLVFHHSLIPEVLYAGITGLRRKFLHRRAAEVMEAYYGQTNENVSQELARHFWEAGSYEKAAQYMRIAADRAKELYANDEAVRLYTTCLEALDRVEPTKPRDELRFEVLNGRQKVYEVLGRKDVARADLEGMVEVALKLADKKRLSDGYLARSAFSILNGEYLLAKEFAEKALTLKREIGDRPGEGKALRLIGTALADLGENKQALEFHSKALKTYEGIVDKRGEASVLFHMGIAWYNLGDYRQALNSYEQALSIYREIHDRRMEGVVLCNLGVVYSRLGDYQQALISFRADLDLNRELGDRRGEAADLHNIGILTKDGGSYELALQYCQQALDINRDVGDRREEGNCLGDIGDIHHRLGEYEKALAHHQEALKIQREIGNKDSEGYQLNDLGNVHESLGEYAKAVDFHQRALSLGEEVGSKYLAVVSKNSLSKAYRLMGGTDELKSALKHSQEATELSSQIGLRLGEIQGLSNQGMAYLSSGEIAKAADCSRKAVHMLEEKAQTGVLEEEVYFNHFKVMKEKGEEKEATDYLRKAYDEVSRKADSIKATGLRDSFLNRATISQKVVHEWRNVQDRNRESAK